MGGRRSGGNADGAVGVSGGPAPRHLRQGEPSVLCGIVALSIRKTNMRKSGSWACYGRRTASAPVAWCSLLSKRHNRSGSRGRFEPSQVGLIGALTHERPYRVKPGSPGGPSLPLSGCSFQRASETASYPQRPSQVVRQPWAWYQHAVPPSMWIGKRMRTSRAMYRSSSGGLVR